MPKGKAAFRDGFPAGGQGKKNSPLLMTAVSFLTHPCKEKPQHTQKTFQSFDQRFGTTPLSLEM